MDRARDKLITQGDREREISWDEVVRKVRVPSVHRTTAAKHMLRELGVKALRPRAKLTRSNIDSVLTRGMPPQATPGQPSVLIFTITQPSAVLRQAGGIGVTVRN